VFVSGATKLGPSAIGRVVTLAAVMLAVTGWTTAVWATPARTSTAAILKAGVIVARDVPAAWTSVPAQKTAELLLVEGVGACGATRAALRAANPGARRAFSRRFVAPDQIGAAQDVVFVGRSVAAAQTYLHAYGGPQGQACVQAVGDAIAKRASGTAAVTPLTDLAGSGDEALGYQILIAAPNHGVTVTLVSDLVVARFGRAVIGFQFQNPILPLPDRPGIVQAVGSRLRTVATG
jgi:hypothetical protein